jgi:hypothetical protein
VLVTNLIFEVFAHQVSKEASYFNLHVAWNGSNGMIVNKQVLLDLTFKIRRFPAFCFFTGRSILQLFIEQITEFTK